MISDKIQSLADKLCIELPNLEDEIDPKKDLSSLSIYDPTTNQVRIAKQEDIDRLVAIEQEYGKILSYLEHQVDHTELYSDNAPDYEEILERNKRLKWGAFGGR